MCQQTIGKMAAATCLAITTPNINTNTIDSANLRGAAHNLIVPGFNNESLQIHYIPKVPNVGYNRYSVPLII